MQDEGLGLLACEACMKWRCVCVEVEKMIVVPELAGAKPLSCHMWKVKGPLRRSQAVRSILLGQSRCVGIGCACEPTCNGCLHCWHTKFILLRKGMHEETDSWCQVK